jgi:hypothetical protein
MAAQLTRSRYNAAKLNADQVFMVLTRHDLTMKQRAAMVEVSTSTIQKICTGAAYSHLFPEIKRLKNRRPVIGPRCDACVHNNGTKCTLSLPERKDQGSRAAVDCVAYTTGRVL